MPTGFLHPGAMGASLAAACRGHRLWNGDGRSEASHHRAAAAGLDGRFVDGGVVGPPLQSPGSTRLYLSGECADEVAALWTRTALETRIVAGGAGAASAVKVCFAAWTKGSAALLLAIRALATAEGVDEALLSEWATSMPHLVALSERAAAGNAPKAWRFAGELEEVAASFAAHDLPDGFGTAAAEVYDRMRAFKDADGATLSEVIDAINHRDFGEVISTYSHTDDEP